MNGTYYASIIVSDFLILEPIHIKSTHKPGTSGTVIYISRRIGNLSTPMGGGGGVGSS